MPNRNEAALFFKSSKPESQQSLRAGVREEAAQRVLRRPHRVVAAEVARELGGKLR